MEKASTNLKVIYHSGYYIGRTDDYFCEDDDYIFIPHFWAWSSDEYDDEFAEEHDVHELTADGYECLNEFLKYYNMNAYQRERYGRSEFERMSFNSMWDYLMSNKDFIVHDKDEAIDIEVSFADPDCGIYTDDVLHIRFDDGVLQAAYENACDCLYYGEGKDVWVHDNVDDELADFVWQTAFNSLAEDYRY